MKLGTRLDARLPVLTAARNKRTLLSVLACPTSGLVDLGASTIECLFLNYF